MLKFQTCSQIVERFCHPMSLNLPCLSIFPQTFFVTKLDKSIDNLGPQGGN